MNTCSFSFLIHTFSRLVNSRNVSQTRVTLWLVGWESLSQVRSPGGGQGREGCILFPFTFPGSQLVQASRSVTARQWAFWLLPRDVVMRSTPFTRSIDGGGGRTALGWSNCSWFPHAVLYIGRSRQASTLSSVISGHVTLLYFHPVLVFFYKDGSVDNARVWKRMSCLVQHAMWINREACLALCDDDTVHWLESNPLAERWPDVRTRWSILKGRGYYAVYHRTLFYRNIQHIKVQLFLY